jgi:hypothetical protein
VLDPSSSPTAWTGPELCVNGTCLFSNAALNGGIAVLTSPQHAQIVQGYDIGDDGSGGANPPPFHVAEIEGKGIGLRANHSIAKGEVLMVRAPTFVAQTVALVELEERVRDMRKLPSSLPSRLAFPFRVFPFS